MCLKTILKKQPLRLLFFIFVLSNFLDISFCHFRHFVLPIIFNPQKETTELIQWFFIKI